MDAHQRDAMALWTVFTHAHDLRDFAPLAIITSPKRRCGKTRLQETQMRLAPRPEPMINVSAATLPRLIEDHHPTLLIDEFDSMMKGDKEMAEMLRGLLNSSFNRAGAGVVKLAPIPGGGWEPRRFSLWAPACIGGIGKPPDTVVDRSIVIRLVRKLTTEKVKRLRGKDGDELDVLRRKTARWVADNEQVLKEAEPEELEGLNDRQQDAWEPLFAIAEAAGGDWPKRAHDAARALCAVDEAEAQEEDIGLLLLSDIRDGFAKAFPEGYSGRKADGAGRPDEGLKLSTKQLLDWLHALEERPWATWGKARKPMTGTQLAAQLHPFRIRSSTIWLSDAITPKGYHLRSFEDVFARYLPSPPFSSRQGDRDTGKQGQSEDFADDRNSIPGVSENAENPSNSGTPVALAAEKGGKRGEARERTEIEGDEISNPFINDGGEDQ
jgi:hypothetical protein